MLPRDVLSRREQPELRTQGLLLRPWSSSDVDAVMTAFADPAIRHWHRRHFERREEASRWIYSWKSHWQANTDASWAVTNELTGDTLGYVALRALIPEAASAQLTYWTLPNYRGQGVATRATSAVAEWAFCTISVHRLYLVHSTANARSCRVAERAGFRLEGTLRGYMLHSDGWHDVHMHARLATDQ